MRVLVRKMSNLGLLKYRMIGITAMSSLAIVGLMAIFTIIDISLWLNPTVLMVLLGGMLFFGSVAFFFGVRPYRIYRSLPEVLVETDEEFLYIHTKKEAKIALCDIDEVTVDVDLPYSLVQDRFWEELIIHVGSENYGTVILELPGHGKYKMRFVSEAQETSDRLFDFLKNVVEGDSNPNYVEKVDPFI